MQRIFDLPIMRQYSYSSSLNALIFKGLASTNP